MASNSAQSDLYMALRKYGTDNKELMLDLYHGLKKSFAETFIIDSIKGAKLGMNWIIKNQDTETSVDDMTFLTVDEAVKLAHWVNTQWAHLPQTVEGQFVYWTSVNNKQRILSNVATFMTGAVLRRRAGSFINKSEVIDSLLREMIILDPKTTRAKAIKLANGITKYYGLVCVCGLDVLFCKQLSLRSLRETTRESFDALKNRNGHVGDGITKAFLEALVDEAVIKKLLGNAIELMNLHLGNDNKSGQKRKSDLKASKPKQPIKKGKKQKPTGFVIEESSEVPFIVDVGIHLAEEKETNQVIAPADLVETSVEQAVPVTELITVFADLDVASSEPLPKSTSSEKGALSDLFSTV
jgi:hypothetical protein